jgi:hypothetical protein
MKIVARAFLAAGLLVVGISEIHAAVGVGAGVPIQADAARPRGRVRSDITYQDTAGPQLVIPIVGSAAGQNGTFFRSAVTLMNFRGFGAGQTFTPQRIKVEYYAAGANNVGATPTFYTLRNVGEYWDNFIAQFFQPAKSGLGTLVITAVDANGNFDPAGLLDGVSRVYTAQASTTGCPTPGGSVSQALSAFPYEDLDSGEATGYMYGLRHDAQFRTNIGVVNHVSVAHTFTVRIIKFIDQPEVNFTIAVQPKSLTHTSIPAGDYGPSMIVEIYTEDPGAFYWSAYGTSVDNATGDGWIYKATW